MAARSTTQEPLSPMDWAYLLGLLALIVLLAAVARCTRQSWRLVIQGAIHLRGSSRRRRSPSASALRRTGRPDRCTRRRPRRVTSSLRDADSALAGPGQGQDAHQRNPGWEDELLAWCAKA